MSVLANPKAREANLFTEEVGRELVVYNGESQHVHRLNPSAAFVWRHCDGERDVADLTTLLNDELKLSDTEDMVWLALEHLSEADLLEGPLPTTTEFEKISRRQLARKFGLAGKLALLAPAVMSLAAPTPAQAGSPDPTGKPSPVHYK